MAKRKLTPTQKKEKERRRREYMTIFIRGKQKRVRRPPTIEGLSVDEFVLRNADPIWLHQNGMWEYIQVEPDDAQYLDDFPDDATDRSQGEQRHASDQTYREPAVWTDEPRWTEHDIMPSPEDQLYYLQLHKWRQH